MPSPLAIALTLAGALALGPGAAVVHGPATPPPVVAARPAGPAVPAPEPEPARTERVPAATAPVPSRSIGPPWAGRLEHGVQLPSSSAAHVTWDPALRRRPNRHWRRWGHGEVVAAVERIARARAAARPAAPRLLVGDLSRPRGGDFGARFGLPGHASHQSGLDVDVYYPRRDGRLAPPDTPAQVDLAEAQRLVDAFLAEGAEIVFTGPSLGLRGPPERVQPLAHHDNHLHVRFPNPPAAGSSPTAPR